MKKIIAMTFAAVSLAACNDTGSDTTTVDTNTSVDSNAAVNTNTAVDSNNILPRGADPTMDTTSTAATSTTTTTEYTPEDGAVTYRNNKLQVRKNGQWVDADEDVRLDNDVVVYRTGRVRQGEREVELREGEVVNKTGRFFDKTGQAIENVWDDTKRGVKKAGKAVGDAAKKAGEKVEDAVDNDNKQ